MGARKEQTLGAAAAFATVLIWSAVYGGKELLLAHMSPAELVAYQYVLAVPAIALLALSGVFMAIYSDYQKKYIDKTESVDKPLEYIGRD